MSISHTTVVQCDTEGCDSEEFDHGAPSALIARLRREGWTFSGGQIIHKRVQCPDCADGVAMEERY